VSSFDQDHATQEACLKAAGCEIVRKEKARVTRLEKELAALQAKETEAAE
jgi:hypothetical protein